MVDENYRPLPVILVGEKNDLEKMRAVKSGYGVELAEDQEIFIQYIEYSFKTGENVELNFRKLTKEMLRRKGLI